MSTQAEQLAYWITEREAMRRRKEEFPLSPGKYGFSDDPHMGLVRYCNVRREDDKVTRWLRTIWLNSRLSPGGWVLARMVNYIPMLELVRADAMRQQWDAVAFIMKSARSAGNKIWTSAYTISTAGNRMDKVDYVMGVVKSADRRAWSFDGLRLATAHGMITQVNGLGSFLGAQIIADMKNTRHHALSAAPDWYEWSAHGPGSLRGLSVYYGRPVTPGQYAKAIEQCWNEVQPLLDSSFQNLHMQDFQNCLCEFSKYARVKAGGHARNTYRPG